MTPSSPGFWWYIDKISNDRCIAKIFQYSYGFEAMFISDDIKMKVYNVKDMDFVIWLGPVNPEPMKASEQ